MRTSRKITHSLFVHTLWAVIPTIGVIQLGKVVQNLFMISAEVINDTALAQEGIQVGLSSLAKVAIDGRTALDFFLVGQVESVQSL